MAERITWIRVGLALTLIGACSRPATAASPSQPSTRPAGPVAYRLGSTAYPDGITSEPDYADWLDKQIATLARRERAAREPAAQLPLVLARANLRLSRQAEPALTRLMLHDATSADGGRLAATLVPAQADLKRAAALLTRLEQSPAPHKAAAKQRERWRSEAANLTVLSDAMAALAGKADAQSCLTALGPLAASKQADLAAAARLLQAALMRQTGKVNEAIALLEPAVIPPEQLPYDFFARLLRCRLLADRGGHAIAAAMAVQIDARCESWFDKSRQAEARRAVGLLRIDLARRWADQLERDGLVSHAARRRAAAAKIRKQLFDKDAVVYRLGLAVPILAKIPQPPAPTTTRRAKSTQPVTAPARKATTSRSVRPRSTTARSTTTRRSPGGQPPVSPAATKPATSPTPER